jgi:exoribonuclease R
VVGAFVHERDFQGVERFAMSTIWRCSASGVMDSRSVWFGRTRMRSARALSYELAQVTALNVYVGG